MTLLLLCREYVKVEDRNGLTGDIRAGSYNEWQNTCKNNHDGGVVMTTLDAKSSLLEGYRLQHCTHTISYLFSLYVLLPTVNIANLNRDFLASGLLLWIKIYFNTLVLLKTKTHSYQTLIVVHLISD